MIEKTTRQYGSAVAITLKILLLLAAVVLVAACGSSSDSAGVEVSSGSSDTSIDVYEAASSVGQRSTVCGEVADTRYASSSRGQPTFLNFEKPFPNHVFTVVIWGDERPRFTSRPESHYLRENVCATGLIESFNGKPQIIARDPSQLEIQ